MRKESPLRVAAVAILVLNFSFSRHVDHRLAADLETCRRTHSFVSRKLVQAMGFVNHIPVSPKRRDRSTRSASFKCRRSRSERYHFRSNRSSVVHVMSAKRVNDSEGTGKEPTDQQKYITLEFARQAFDHAIKYAENGIHSVAEKCAVGFVEAYMQCYSVEETPSVFAVCGPGLNGLIGLYIARELKAKGYDVAIHSVSSSRYTDIASFCKQYDLLMFDFVPSTIEFYYQAVIDALLGVGFDGGDIREPYWQVQEMLVTTNLPIASVDVPTGWDLTTGPRPIDVSVDTFIKPDLLVSLGAPLPCAQVFAGEYHFIAGRHLPADYYRERGISVPIYPLEAHSVLFGSTVRPYVGNGAVYGRPGQFNATLFTKNPRRKWVDIDEEMDLWDELE